MKARKQKQFTKSTNNAPTKEPAAPLEPEGRPRFACVLGPDGPICGPAISPAEMRSILEREAVGVKTEMAELDGNDEEDEEEEAAEGEGEELEDDEDEDDQEEHKDGDDE